MDLSELTRAIASGERRALARAITLIESSKSEHRDLATQLLERLEPPGSVARRVGLTGTPGVGKSTFIETYGLRLADAGHRIAVLAVDPSSTRSGGSILGDKTRMERLSRHPNAFIRPSPSQGTLGGVARRTRETIRLVEAAGYGTVLIETVGVGQSETMVSEMTDIFLLLLAPAGGDELQGVKRGIMEIADIVVINKADGALKPLAESTRAEYSGALNLMRRRDGDPEGIPGALCLSATTGDGLDSLMDRIDTLFAWRFDTGWIERRRAQQARTALHRALETHAIRRIFEHPALHARLDAAAAAVAEGSMDPERAAAMLFDLIDRP
ncbi:MAG: methylmalonyl Co-A mutase-associated GTPase MeaB [Pseudomonadota bacterium]